MEISGRNDAHMSPLENRISTRELWGNSEGFARRRPFCCLESAAFSSTAITAVASVKNVLAAGARGERIDREHTLWRHDDVAARCNRNHLNPSHKCDSVGIKSANPCADG